MRLGPRLKRLKIERSVIDLLEGSSREEDSCMSPSPLGAYKPTWKRLDGVMDA